MAQLRAWGVARLDRQSLVQSTRTAVAAVAATVVARAVKLPEYYWAPITTLVIMQSTLGAAWDVSVPRIIGTALGALLGALLAPRFGGSVVAFGAGVLVLGLICAATRAGSSAYRFGGITLAIVVLIARHESPWLAATHRFVEVAIGVVIGLAVTALWPARETPAT